MSTISEVTASASSAARSLLYSKQIPIGSSDNYPGNITAFDPSTWTMDDAYFADRMFAAAAIGIVIALASFFMCIIWIMCRLAATNCGTGSDGEGNCFATGCLCQVCCGTGDSDPDGYTDTQRTALFCMVLFLTGWVLVCCLIGVRGVDHVVSATVNVFDEAMAGVATMENNNNLAQVGLLKLGVSYSGQSMNSAVLDVSNHVKDLDDKVDTYNNGVKLAAYIFYTFFVANLLNGFFSYCCMKGCFSMLMAFFGYCLVVCSWLLFAVFYMSGVYIDDTCVQLQLWNDCKAFQADTVALQCSEKLKLQHVVKCPNTAMFNTEYNATWHLLNSKIDAYKTAFPADSARFPKPGQWSGSTQIQADSAGLYSNNVNYRKYLYQREGGVVPACTPAANAVPLDYTYNCVSTCLSNQSYAQSPPSQSCHQKGILLTTDVLLELSYTASCSYVTDVAANATKSDGSCDTMAKGLLYEFAAQGCLGSLYVIIVWVGAKGFHVFQRPTEAQEENQRINDTMHAAEQRRAIPGSVSAGIARQQRRLEEQEEDRYEVTENKQLQEHLQNYFTKWVPGVSVPGPPPETFFHSVLNRRVIEEGNHGCKEGDDDDDRMSLEQIDETFSPIEMPDIVGVADMPQIEPVPAIQPSEPVGPA